ncbi:MAG TPA: UvrD-helicase domain-containing protein [Rhodanobacteraceae bacterium]
MNRLVTIAASDMALTLPLTSRQLIEASAGTGKTYTIAGLYARLVVERALPVRQVLVMTFTRAATEELRQRLRDRLATCADLAAREAAGTPLQADEATDEQAWALALLRRALASGHESAQALAERLRQAVTGMDEAAIFTIHGFCQRVLGAHTALLDDTVAGAELVASDLDLLEDFAEQAWLRVAGAGDADELAALRQLAASPQDLAGLLRDLVSFAGPLEPLPGKVPEPVDGEAAWARLLSAWRSGGEQAMAVFDEWLSAGYLNKNKFKADASALLHREGARLAAGFDPDADVLVKFAHSRVSAAVRKDMPAFPAAPALAALDEWAQARQDIAARCRVMQPVLLHRLRDEARAWLARRKHDLARVSYDDLIACLAHGVGTEGRHRQALVKALRDQYPVALVDEFQDTDARQFGILDALYGNFGTLYMIGDPKQAIYGFRGGDVHAYLRAKQGATRHTLKQNFRSAPAMLRAVEAVFTACANPFVEAGIAFEKVQSGGHVDDGALVRRGEPVKPLTFWTPQPKSTHDDDVRQCMAQACAYTVADLLDHATLDGQPLKPARMAVLTARNKDAALVQDALRAAGVPAVCLRKESIYASSEARELLRVLDALLLLQSVRRARGALVTELMGRTLADLARMQSDEVAWSAALDELAQLRESWFARGIAAMVEALAARNAPRLLALPDGHRRLSNLLQLGELLAADNRQLAGEQALRDALAAHIRTADQHNEAEQLRLETDAQCVQIVTLHRSKGLEYDVVLMPFVGLDKNKAPRQGTCPRFHRGDEAVRRLILSGSKDKDRDAGDAEACVAAQGESLAEDVRTFYVGITRARHACFVAGGGSTLKQLLGGEGHPGALVESHAALMALVAPEDVAPVHHASASSTDPGQARVFARRLPRDWWVHSFSQWAAGARDAVVAAGGAGDEALAEDAPSVDAASAGDEVPTWPRGPRYGNAVHAVLEKTDFASWRDSHGEVPPAAQGLLVRKLREAGLGGDNLAPAQAATARLIAAALNQPVVDDVRLCDIDPADRRAEMPFHFGIDAADPRDILACLHAHGYQRQHADYAHLGTRLRGLMTGIIDLVFRHAGQWWIVDYKTNDLGAHGGDYAAARLPAAIAAHDYDLQYLIYTVALHRWLRLTLGGAYDYARDVGGVRYLFVRGMTAGQGVFADKPPRELIETLDTLLRARPEVVA